MIFRKGQDDEEAKFRESRHDWEGAYRCSRNEQAIRLQRVEKTIASNCLECIYDLCILCRGQHCHRNSRAGNAPRNGRHLLCLWFCGAASKFLQCISDQRGGPVTGHAGIGCNPHRCFDRHAGLRVHAHSGPDHGVSKPGQPCTCRGRWTALRSRYGSCRRVRQRITFQGH